MPKTTKHPRPFTYDLGTGQLPFVSLHYRDRPADLLAMAHEFGHAVQIVASHSAGQMPPVARECCAFLAERALVAQGGDTCADLVQAYGADDAVYFGEHRAALARALAEAERPYAYIWNYPLARHLAAHLFDATAADQIAGLYRAGSAGGRALDRMAQGLARGERAA